MNRGAEAQVYVCKHDGCVFDSHSRMKYLTFSFLRSGKKVKRGVKFGYSVEYVNEAVGLLTNSLDI